MVGQKLYDDEFLFSICQQLAGNAELRPAPRAPGMDTRAGRISM